MTKPIQRTICIIDDDKIYQFTAKKLIESTGLTNEILVFYNGKEALDYFIENEANKSNFPDIVFLDINMPIMNGWQFLEAFEQLNETLEKTIIIYMVSSSVDDYDIDKSKESALIKDYLIKPINREQFEQLISL